MKSIRKVYINKPSPDTTPSPSSTPNPCSPHPVDDTSNIPFNIKSRREQIFHPFNKINKKQKAARCSDRNMKIY